jgi:hypothetical protein
MKVIWSPQRSDAPAPVVSASGDILTIDGQAMDFSQLQDGDILLAEAVDHPGVMRAVKVDGEIEVTVILPVAADATEEERHPEPTDAPAGVAGETAVAIDWAQMTGLNAVPDEVSRFQAKAALAAAGKLDQVEVLIAAADQFTRLAWSESANWHRNSQTLQSVQTAAGLTDEEVDDLFRAAAQIEA